MPDDTPAAVLLDYYGTLAHATHWISADDVLAEHGYELPLETVSYTHLTLPTNREV